MAKLIRAGRMSAALLAAGLSLAGPQAVGIALADSDLAGRPGRDSASAHDGSASSADKPNLDMPEVVPLPPPPTDDADASGEIEFDSPEAQPAEPEIDSGEAVVDLPEPELPKPEVDPIEETVEHVVGEAVPETGVPLPVLVGPLPEALPADQAATDPEASNEQAGEDSGTNRTVGEDADSGAGADDDSGTDAADGETEEATVGRGGGLVAQPYWRGFEDTPADDLEALPVLNEDSGTGVPDPVHFEGAEPQAWILDVRPAEQPDQTVLTQAGVGQSSAGSGQLVTAVVTVVSQILDSVSNWLATLPSEPFSEFLAGLLLQIRKALPVQIVKETSSEPVSELPVPDGADFLDELTGLSETDAAAVAAEKGLTVRIVARDGEHYMVTMDYRIDRVNFTVENGVVVEANVG